jgi:hypothetical protein
MYNKCVKKIFLYREYSRAISKNYFKRPKRVYVTHSAAHIIIRNVT